MPGQEWIAGFVEKLQEKDQYLHEVAVNMKYSMKNLTELCSFHPK